MVDQRSYWARVWQRRSTRRRLLKGTALTSAGLVSAAVLGCAEESLPAAAPQRSPGVTPAAAQAKRGGTFLHPPPVTGLFKRGLDPHINSGADDGPMNLFYQGLVLLNPNTDTSKPPSVEPSLAQKWEQPSQTEYIFHLAPGVKWHNKPPVNGRALAATDVVSSLERLRTENPTFINRKLLTTVDRIEAVDNARVKLTSKAPDVTTVFNLADVTVLMVAPEAAEKFEKFVAPDLAIGTGAFMAKSLDETIATTVRNPDYWKPGLPYLDGVNLLAIAFDTQWPAFLAEKMHIVTAPGTEAKKVLAEVGKRYGGGIAKSGFPIMIYPNLQRTPFNDPRVPRALRLLVDHQEAKTAFLDVRFGAGTSFTFPEVLEFWELPTNEYERKLEWRQPKSDAAKEALALLSAAGLTKDSPLTFEQGIGTGEYLGAGQLMNAQWRQLSQGAVQPTLKTYDAASSSRIQVQGQFDVWGPQGRQAFFDPDALLTRLYGTGGDVNFGKYSNPQLDQLIARQRTIFNLEQRRALVREIIGLLIDNAPYSSFGCDSRVSIWSLKAKNITPESGRPHMWQYEHVWLDA